MRSLDFKFRLKHPTSGDLILKSVAAPMNTTHQLSNALDAPGTYI